MPIALFSLSANAGIAVKNRLITIIFFMLVFSAQTKVRAAFENLMENQGLVGPIGSYIVMTSR